MAKTKKHTLDKKEPAVKPPFNMAEPNDDLHAFAWAMDRMRYPSKDSKKGDVWPGASVFGVPEADAEKDTYGYNVAFVNGAYLQFMLDHCPGIRDAAQKCSEADYSEDSLAELRTAVMAAFRTVVLPDIAKRFKKISRLVAEFYAARMAHIETFGVEE
jgi:hypothetical protein